MEDPWSPSFTASPKSLDGTSLNEEGRQQQQQSLAQILPSVPTITITEEQQQTARNDESEEEEEEDTITGQTAMDEERPTSSSTEEEDDYPDQASVREIVLWKQYLESVEETEREEREREIFFHKLGKFRFLLISLLALFIK